ncbi:MAG TPA: hypothetical protein VKY89_04395 [Thermoanaerobaculia bacterium]|nr:hypothetical protein [Thermoanaerobaculia bacterium]
MIAPRLTRAAARQAWYLRAAAAAWGFALAASLVGYLQRPAPPGQLPGAMTAMGLDAAGPFLGLAALLLLPFAAAFAGGLLASQIAAGPPWALLSAGVALATAPLTVIYGGGPLDVLLHALFGAGAAAAASVTRTGVPSDPAGHSDSRDRRRPIDRRHHRGRRFSRADVLLIPTSLVAYFAILDLAPAGWRPVTCWLIAAGLTLALRLAAGRLSSLRRPGLALAPAPLAVLLQLQWLPAAGAAIAALAWIAAATLAVALLLRTPAAERRLRGLLTLAIYPLFVLAYPLALLGIGSPVGLDFFEDGHELVPAAAMAHGKLPYADVVPQHGLISDGGIDLLVIASGHTATRDLLLVRRVVRCASFAGIYFVALATTGAAEAGLLAALLSVTLFPGMGLRPAMALLALAAAAVAVRRRSLRWLAAAGAAVAIAFLVSPDFAVYSGAAAAVAALRWARRGRALAVLALGSGAAAAGAVILGAFAVMGFAGAFLRVTFGELPPAGRAYTIGPLAGPACLHALATSPASWVQPECVCALAWILVVIATAAALARAPLTAARGDGLWLIGIWTGLAGAAYVERRHLYASVALAAFLIGAVFLLSRRRARPAALALALTLAWLANPFGHLFGLATPLRAKGREAPTTAAAGALDAIPRCRGVVIEPALRPAILAVARFAGGHLRPGETWFDFTNHPALYYLFERDCPVRHLDVPFVESAAAQREIIARLERDRTVRAALIAFPDWFTAIDGVANRDRAPLIWRYLERRFAPAFDDHGVVFWLRR